MKSAGCLVVLATPDGDRPFIDAVSDSAESFGGDPDPHERAKAFVTDHPWMNRVRTLPSVIGDELDEFAGLHVPGGHAMVFDLKQERNALTLDPAAVA